MATQPKNNHVMFVCSNPQVTELLYDYFGAVPELSNHFYIEGSAATRESAIDIARTKRPGTILFFERTAGIASISKTIYAFRQTGARVIYISSERYIGDPILETVVGYGVYDIVLSDEINLDLVMDYMLRPRDFNDVSIFYREVEIADDGGADRGFKLPELDMARQFSINLDNDYLIDPMQRAVNKIAPNIKRDKEDRSVGSLIYRDVDQERQAKIASDKAALAKRKQKLAQEQAAERRFEVPDFDF